MDNLKAFIMFIGTMSAMFYVFTFITVIMLYFLFEKKFVLRSGLLYSLAVLLLFYLFMFTGRGFNIHFLWILAFYLGVIIMWALMFAVILKLANFAYPLSAKLNFILLVSLIFSFFVYGYYNAHRILIPTISLTSDKISEPYRFALISDVHLGTESLDYLDRVVYEVNKLKPDAVFITGDLLDDPNLEPKDVKGLADLTAPAYFVTGNHERYSRYNDEFFEECRVVTVLDHYRRKHDFNEEVTVFGIEWNRYNFSNKKSEQAVFFDSIKVDTSRYNIFLNHEPSLVEEAENSGMDLMLAGHTHRGQIFPFNFFVRIQYRYVYGLYRIGNMDLYVTSGTGVWGPFLRLGSNNEIVLITLDPEF